VRVDFEAELIRARYDVLCARRLRGRLHVERRRAPRRLRLVALPKRDTTTGRVVRASRNHREAECGIRAQRNVPYRSSKMLGGASQIVSMIRVKCNGTQKDDSYL
jgi:hypothetical protein